MGKTPTLRPPAAASLGISGTMAFSAAVEAINVIALRKRRKKAERKGLR